MVVVDQPGLWDPVAGEAAKEEGKARAAEGHATLLDVARELARRHGQMYGTCTADDVQRALDARGVSVRALGNAAGSLFRGSEWEWTGEFVKSDRVHAHRNLLRVWRYVG